LNKPLVLQCQSWSDCLTGLKGHPCLVKNTNAEQELKLALLPVVSLAWYAARYFPDLLERDQLDVWIIGAELIDGKDEGAWYGCLKALLGIDLVSYRLIGPALTSSTNDRVLSGTLDEALGQGLAPPDLAVIFQPGLEENTSMLEAGLSDLLRSNTRVIASSYNEEEFERDRLMTQAYGFQAGEPVDNPFALDPAETGLKWASTLWQFKPVVPSAGHRPDESLIDAVKCLSHMVAHSRIKGFWNQPAAPGSLFLIPGTGGGQRQMIHIFDNFYLDRAAHTLYGLDGGRLRPTAIQVSNEDILAYPEHAAPIDLALWAAGIKKLYLLSPQI
jgi:hypothetical protein